MLFCLVSQCFRIRSQMFICKRETELLKLFSLPFFYKCYHTLILTCEISLLLAFPGRNLLSDAFLPHKSMFPNPLFSSRGFFFVLFSRVFFSYSVVNVICYFANVFKSVHSLRLSYSPLEAFFSALFSRVFHKVFCARLQLLSPYHNDGRFWKIFVQKIY